MNGNIMFSTTLNSQPARAQLLGTLHAAQEMAATSVQATVIATLNAATMEIVAQTLTKLALNVSCAKSHVLLLGSLAST